MTLLRSPVTVQHKHNVLASDLSSGRGLLSIVSHATPVRQGLGTALGNAFQTFVHFWHFDQTACLDSDIPSIVRLDMRGSATFMKIACLVGELCKWEPTLRPIFCR